MSIPGGLKYVLLAVLFIAATISAFPVLAAVAIVFQFAIVLSIPLLAAVALAVPRIRKALFKAAEPRPATMPEAQRESPPSLLSVVAGKDPRRSLANGFAIAAVIIAAVVAFPLLAALGLVFQYLAIFSLAVVLLSFFLVRAFRTTESNR